MIARRTLLGAAGATAGGVLLPSRQSAARPLPPAGPRVLRVMAWNIFRGGKGVSESGVGVGAENFQLMLDQFVSVSADVYLTIETYGAGPAIVQALNERHGAGTYTGYPITQRADDTDNLWIVTRLDVEKELPPLKSGGLFSDFNLGGLRVRKGRSFNVLVTWLQYTNPWIGYLIDENAAAVRAGVQPRHDPVPADRLQTDQMRELVDVQLPVLLEGNTDPVIFGGDLNTNAASDWGPRWSGAPEHFGLSYDLTATKVAIDAGFVDTFREVHPDAGAVQGRTWSPLPVERMITPSRIDLIFAKGVAVKDSVTIDERLGSHPKGPWYSDHAAVVTDFDLSS